uniref:Uncharacterized protein n=1 Tax=Anguilla anguilla TaxID=7936 RepID=A0A0E9QVY2_ANGAN
MLWHIAGLPIKKRAINQAPKSCWALQLRDHRHRSIHDDSSHASLLPFGMGVAFFKRRKRDPRTPE